jgi:hypothetical protein
MKMTKMKSSSTKQPVATVQGQAKVVIDTHAESSTLDIAICQQSDTGYLSIFSSLDDETCKGF